MTIDKNALKKLIDKTKPADIQVITYSHLDSSNYKSFLTELNKLISKSEDYAVIVLKK